MIGTMDHSEVNWPAIKKKLPVSLSESDQQSLEKLWQNFDFNSKGYISEKEAE
jgi:hypothetical protein